MAFVKLTNGNCEILLASNDGRAIRFNENKFRAMGRTATGVKGMRLGEGDEVIGIVSLADQTRHIMVVSEKGYGKRSEVDEYRITGRGGKGVKAMNTTDKTGKLVAIMDVSDEDDLMIINRSGYTIRMSVAEMSSIGSGTTRCRVRSTSASTGGIGPGRLATASVTRPSNSGQSRQVCRPAYWSAPMTRNNSACACCIRRARTVSSV